MSCLKLFIPRNQFPLCENTNYRLGCISYIQSDSRCGIGSRSLNTDTLHYSNRIYISWYVKLTSTTNGIYYFDDHFIYPPTEYCGLFHIEEDIQSKAHPHAHCSEVYTLCIQDSITFAAEALPTSSILSYNRQITYHKQVMTGHNLSSLTAL